MTTLAPIRHKVEVPWWAFDAMQDRTPGRVAWITGGLGAGKSHGGQIWDVQRVLDNGTHRDDPQPTRSWTVAPNYRICETLLELTLKVAQDVFGLREKKHYQVRLSSPQGLDFRPMGLNHRLSFLSADNPKHFVSASLTHWRWSEVGVSKPDTYDKLMDRLRDQRAKVLQALGDGTPEGMNHYADLADLTGTKRVRFDPKRNFMRYIVETSDNAKNLAPGYVEILRSRYAYDTSKLLSYEKGLFVPFTKSTAYWEWYESRNVAPMPVNPTPHCAVNLTFDFNVSPLAIIVIQERVSQKHYDAPRESKLIAVWESSGESRGLMDGIAEFASAFPQHQYGDTPINVYGDASGWARNLHTASSSYTEIDNYLRALGYRNVNLLAFRANPTQRDRLEKTAALMTYERFLVDSRCRRLIQSFAKTTLVEGTYEIDKPKDDKHSHWADSATYCLFQIAKDIDLARPSTRRAYGA